MISSLLGREDLHAEGSRVLAAQYPSAPDQMITTAVHHVYGDGVVAATDFLVEIERSIRNPSHRVEMGIVVHLLFHLYNWLAFESILPIGSEDLLDHVRELRTLVEDDDREAVLGVLEDLQDLLDGSRLPPDVV